MLSAKEGTQDELQENDTLPIFWWSKDQKTPATEWGEQILVVLCLCPLYLRRCSQSSSCCGYWPLATHSCSVPWRTTLCWQGPSWPEVPCSSYLPPIWRLPWPVTNKRRGVKSQLPCLKTLLPLCFSACSRSLHGIRLRWNLAEITFLLSSFSCLSLLLLVLWGLLRGSPSKIICTRITVLGSVSRGPDPR